MRLEPGCEYLVTACGIWQGSPGSLWESQDPLELRFLTSEPDCLCFNYSFGICTLYDFKQVMKTLCLSSLTCKYEDDGYNKNHMSTCPVEFLWGSDEIIGKKNCRIKWNYGNCRKKVITFFLGEGGAEGEERSLSKSPCLMQSFTHDPKMRTWAQIKLDTTDWAT